MATLDRNLLNLLLLLSLQLLPHPHLYFHVLLLAILPHDRVL